MAYKPPSHNTPRRTGYQGQGSFDWAQREQRVRQEQIAKTEPGKIFRSVWPSWPTLFSQLTAKALTQLENGRLPDPCVQGTWKTPSACIEANLRRYGVDQIKGMSLTQSVARAFIDGQSASDSAADLRWGYVSSEQELKTLNRAACVKLTVDFDDPSTWEQMTDKRAAVGRQLKLDPSVSDQVSRYVVGAPDSFNETEILSWRIGTARWINLARGLGYEAPLWIANPVGVFVTPAESIVKGEVKSGWTLNPVLNFEMILLIDELGGEIDRDLTGGSIPTSESEAFVARVNQHVLSFPGARRDEGRKSLRQTLQNELGTYVPDVGATNSRERWGQLLLKHRRGSVNSLQAAYDEIQIKVNTPTVREFPRQRVGSIKRDTLATHFGGGSGIEFAQSSEMDLGEALSVALDHDLALLLSSEAGATMAGNTSVARMRGRPGMLTITRGGDGISAQVETLNTLQAPGAIRALRQSGEDVTLDAGAFQTYKMSEAKPISDDPILLGRQAEVAALKVVGSGVDASDTACGKTVTTARALMHRADKTARLRALVICPNRQVQQWATELAEGNVLRELPPLVPNAMICTVDHETTMPVAAQIRTADRAAGNGALVVIGGEGLLKSVPGDLAAINWHLLVIDEAHHYANVNTAAHRGLLVLRAAAADCWMLSATPIGKTAEHLDVLVGLALNDKEMIRDRLTVRSAGDLQDEMNAHRVRAAYGPYLVRVTHEDMAAHKPSTPPAKAMAIDPDPALEELLLEIRKGGQTAYEKLLSIFKQLKTLNDGTEKYLAALNELRSAQAYVLGNVNVFVSASVDPGILLRSESAMAKGLSRTDLITNALQGAGSNIPTLRGLVAEAVTASVNEDEQVLVFSERVWGARLMAKTLREQHGVKVGVLDGQVSTEDSNALMAAFTDGEIKVLCVTKIAQEGFNLQSASQVVHLDMPWVPRDLEQRVGRAARIGNTAKEVHSMIPYIKGGGIEHVIKVLAPRAAEQHQLLDGFEGMSPEQATLSSQLLDITAKVAKTSAEDGYGEASARLQVAAAVFGSGRV